jgi:hypothetical protein
MRKKKERKYSSAVRFWIKICRHACLQTDSNRRFVDRPVSCDCEVLDFS